MSEWMPDRMPENGQEEYQSIYVPNRMSEYMCVYIYIYVYVYIYIHIYINIYIYVYIYYATYTSTSYVRNYVRILCQGGDHSQQGVFWNYLKLLAMNPANHENSMIWDGMICWWISMVRYWAKGPIILKLRGFPCSLTCHTLTLRCQDADDLPPAFQAKQNEEIGVQHLGSRRKGDIQVASYQKSSCFWCVCVWCHPRLTASNMKCALERVHRYG